MRSCWTLPLLAGLLLLPVPGARGDEAAEQLILATYKLANPGSTATGLVVRRETDDGKSQRFLVTAHHVFEKMNDGFCLLVSRSRRDDGTYVRRDIRIDIRKGERALWRKHPQHDLAVLRLPESVDVESLPLDSLATEELLAKVHAGDGVRLAVFPERSEANNAGFPLLRRGAIAGYPIVPFRLHPLFLVDTNTWKGDSGGPVIHESLRSESGGPVVVGIVLGMRNITDTVKESRFVERKTHFPLGISEVLHAVFVREMIDEEGAKK